MCAVSVRHSSVCSAADPRRLGRSRYLHKPDWNVGDPIESDRCTGRFLTLPPAERVCTSTSECLAVCSDNGMPCKCVGEGPCEPGAGSLPKFEMRRGKEQTWLGFQTYMKQPTACPWGGAFLVVFSLGAGFYVVGGIQIGRHHGRRPGLGVPTLFAMHPHYEMWLSVSSLVKDGIALTKERGSCRGSIQTNRPTQPHKRQRSPRKKTQRECLSIPLRDGGTGVAEPAELGRYTMPAEPSPKSPANPSPSAGGGTAAGDGGRWVRVPA